MRLTGPGVGGLDIALSAASAMLYRVKATQTSLAVEATIGFAGALLGEARGRARAVAVGGALGEAAPLPPLPPPEMLGVAVPLPPLPPPLEVETGALHCDKDVAPWSAVVCPVGQSVQLVAEPPVE